jgi:hypothetical protein
MNLTFYLSGLLSFFKDKRIIENIEQMIQKIIEKKTIRLFKVTDDKKEYNRYKSLLDGSLKSVLNYGGKIQLDNYKNYLKTIIYIIQVRRKLPTKLGYNYSYCFLLEAKNLK